MLKLQSPAERLRIAHVVHNMDVGGLEKLVVELITRANASRFTTMLICLGDGGELYRELKQQGYDVLAMNKGAGVDFVLILRMARCLRRDRIDIVHCHNWNPLVYGGIGGRLARCRGIVYTLHGPEIPTVRRRVILQRMRVADRIITVSEHVRQSAIVKGGFDPASVTTILNGIDVDRYGLATDRSAVRAEIGVSEHAAVLGVVARLSEEKDHRTLLNSFRIVVDRHPSTVLVVVGEGRLGADLRRQSSTLGIEKNVRFLGNRDDVPQLLGAFDLFVLASREEGLGITLLEAMAARLPVVATQAGGIPEVVLHKETGLVVPIADARAFAEAVNWMLSNRHAAQQMGERGKRRAEEQFGIERMLRQYETVYEDVARVQRAA